MQCARLIGADEVEKASLNWLVPKPKDAMISKVVRCPRQCRAIGLSLPKRWGTS
jgi:hypothetical protein